MEEGNLITSIPVTPSLSLSSHTLALLIQVKMQVFYVWDRLKMVMINFFCLFQFTDLLSQAKNGQVSAKRWI